MAPPALANNDSRAKPRAVILVYHHVAVDGSSGSRRWHLTVALQNFRDQMYCLADQFRTEKLSKMAWGPDDHGEQAVYVTFDDGYAETVAVVSPVLRNCGIPATYFISGVGALHSETFWWERLSEALDEMRLSGDDSSMLHIRLAAMPAGQRAAVLDQLPIAGRPLPRRMSDASLAELAADPLVEIGAHGWSHRAMNMMSCSELVDDIGTNLADLRSFAPCDQLAFPFGVSTGEQAREVLRGFGIERCYTTADRAVTDRSDPLALPRIVAKDVPGPDLVRSVSQLLEQSA